MYQRISFNLDIVFRILESILRRILLIANTFQAKLRLEKAGKNIRIFYPSIIRNYNHISIGNNVLICRNSRFLCTIAKIIIKDNVQIGENVTMVAGNHNNSEIGKFMIVEHPKLPIHDKGIQINEDAFIIFNATILDGVTIGRGVIVGTGAVVRVSIPPYAIALGNPAKVIGFRFTPEQIIEHEKILYKETERIPLEELEKNYIKYYKNRLSEIVSFMKL